MSSEITKMTEENVFDKMEAAQNEIASTEKTEKTDNAAPVDYTALSNKAIGDKTKYIRESLNGQTITIKSAELFYADTSKPIIKDKYYNCNFVLTYDKKNSSGIDNREYIPGVKQFLNDGNKLSDPQFWYEGSQNTIAGLWEAVAKFKNIKPKELSPQRFMAFLNDAPKAKIKLVKGEFYDEKQKKKIPYEKNIVEEFVE